MDVRSVIDSLVEPPLILLPRWGGLVPKNDHLWSAINKAEKEMERMGLSGKWTVLGPSILRFSHTNWHGVSFKIEKVSESDPVADLALSGDIMVEPTPKILKVRWMVVTENGSEGIVVWEPQVGDIW